MAKRAYKFTDKKHTRKGLGSLAAAAVSAVLTAYVLFWSFRESGNAGSFAGLLGLSAMICAVCGFVMALMGLREEDVYYVTAYAGAALDGILIIVWMMICIVGM